MKKKTLHILLIALAVTVGAVLLFGCGFGGQASHESTAPTAAPQGETDAQPTVDTVPAETEAPPAYAEGTGAAATQQPTPDPADAEAAEPQTVTTGLVISEIMVHNACTVATSGGRFLGWVELYNAGEEPESLDGFCLSDREDDPVRCRLPAVTLTPGQYALIYCGGAEAFPEGDISVPLALNSEGGVLLLASSTGAVADRVDYAAARADRSFVRTESGEFEETDHPTPGFPNSGAGYSAFLTSFVPEDLYISEAMPDNRTEARTRGAYYDWVELCNGSEEPLSLEGYSLTDDPAVPDKYVLPEISLNSGARLLVYCSGDASLTDRTAYHCPIRLNSGEDRLYLYRDGQLADYLHIYRVPVDGSIGRTDPADGVCLYDAPTPGKANKGGRALRLPSAMPTADVPSGVYENTESLLVALTGPGTIFYTADGSRPTENSAVYTEPIEITQSAVLRAVALEEDKGLSDVLTLAYTLNGGHRLPVVNLVLAPEDLRGLRGIYTRPDDSWQKAGCLIYTDANGTVTHDCGIRMGDRQSDVRSQRSFRLVFSDQYGGRISYDIFGGDCEQTSFPQLMLKAGQDSRYCIYREALIQHLAMPYRSTTFVPDSVPCVVYVNGAYYGVYQFMEDLTEETLADRLGVHVDSLTVHRGTLTMADKDLEIFQLMQYVQNHDMRDSEHYEYVKARLAFQDLNDWAIFQAYCHNTELNGHVIYFKSAETDGRWHVAFSDAENGFKTAAGLDLVLQKGQTAIFLKALLRNEEFRDMFLKRLSYHCENTFRQDRVLSLLYAYNTVTYSETGPHAKRWNFKPVSYVNSFRQVERLLTADRAGELKKSAKTLLKLTDEEYQYYFGS